MTPELRQSIEEEIDRLELKLAELDEEKVICEEKLNAFKALIAGALEEVYAKKSETARRFSGRPADEYARFLEERGNWARLKDFDKHFRHIGHPHAENVLKNSVPGNLLNQGVIVRHPDKASLFGLPKWLELSAENNEEPNRAVRPQRSSLMDFCEELLRSAKCPLHINILSSRLKEIGQKHSEHGLEASLNRLVGEGRRFFRSQPRTFGLIEWKGKNSEESGQQWEMVAQKKPCPACLIAGVAEPGKLAKAPGRIGCTLNSEHVWTDRAEFEEVREQSLAIKHGEVPEWTNGAD